LGMKHNIASINAINHLAEAQNELSDSLKRLSSGQRVNSGADDPSGLILSEGLRAQVASAQQALQNSEFSLSLVQTAEGALVEVNNLLIEMRQLATTAANEGATDYNALLALQFQIRKAIEGIDRVSRFTSFGNKTLLDGSHGATGMGGNEELVFLKASSKTVASPVSGYNVDITESPMRANLTTVLDDESASGLQITLEEEDGAVIRVSNPEGATAVGFAKRLQKAVLEANMNLKIRFDADDEELIIEHREYGLTKGFTVTGTKDDVIVDNAFEPELLLGRDIEGTINDEPADGDGLILTGDYNNEKTSGLSVAFLGDGTGNAGSGTIQGFEWENMLNVSSNLSMDASLGYLKTWVEKFIYFASEGMETSGGDREAAMSPVITGSLRLNYSNDSGIFGSVRSSYKSGYFYSDSHNEKAEPYTLTNLALGKSFGKTTTTIWIRNAFDERFTTRGFYFGLIPPDYPDQLWKSYGDPRQIGVSMDYKF